MADIRKSVENLEVLLQFLKRADQVGLAERIQDVLTSAAQADETVKERQAELAKITAEMTSRKDEKEDQVLRAAQAKQAADDIVKACKELADAARAEKAAAEKELQDSMREIQMQQGERQKKMDEDLRKYRAEMEAAKVATRKVVEEEKAALMADLGKSLAERDAMQSEVNQLRGRLQQILNSR